MLIKEFMTFQIFLMLVLIFLKGTNISGWISCINTIRRDVMCHDGASSNYHIVSNARIAKHNTVSTDKHVITDLNDSYLGMGTGFGCAGIMGKDLNVACQRNVIANGN